MRVSAYGAGSQSPAAPTKTGRTPGYIACSQVDTLARIKPEFQAEWWSEIGRFDAPVEYAPAPDGTVAKATQIVAKDQLLASSLRTAQAVVAETVRWDRGVSFLYQSQVPMRLPVVHGRPQMKMIEGQEYPVPVLDKNGVQVMESIPEPDQAAYDSALSVDVFVDMVDGSVYYLQPHQAASLCPAPEWVSKLSERGGN